MISSLKCIARERLLQGVNDHMILKILLSIIFGAAWLALCIFKYTKWSNKAKNCVQECPVTVVEVLEKLSRGTRPIYKPVFRPLDPMNETVIDSALYTSRFRFEVGQNIVLLVNPDNIKDFLYKDDDYNIGRKADMMSCFIPLIFIIAIILISLNK